ncbi:MAG: ATP-binding protein [Bacteroidota bacterium]
MDSSSDFIDPLVRRLRHSSLSLVAIRVALGMMAAGGALWLVLRLVGWAIPAWQGALGALFLAVCGYVVAHRVITDRLNLSMHVLRQVRNHQFESLELARVPKGDELNVLVWQVYRTGLALEKEIEELKKIENYRREFLGNVSHELKTPIFSIRGFAETLLGGALDDERVRSSFVERILRNADRLTNLVQDLSEISRIETGELEIERVPFDLAQVAHEVIDSLEPLAAGRGVTLHSRVREGLPEAFGSSERIRQVLSNLVENAIKYNTEGGHVELIVRAQSRTPKLQRDEEALRTDQTVIKVSIADDGIGIAPQHMPRITERFYRVDKSRSRAQGGTGLGLAIVKHILSAHGTTLQVQSTPGLGSTFGFTLPVVQQPVAPALSTSTA